MLLRLRQWCIRKLIGEAWITYFYSARLLAQSDLSALASSERYLMRLESLSETEKSIAQHGYTQGTVDAISRLMRMIGLD